MANMWVDVDAAVTVPVNVMSLIDDTNFKTREEAVTFDQAGLDLVWNFETTAGVQTQVAVTPTNTGGDYDWVNVGGGMYNIEIPASGGASINNDAEGFGWFTGFATGILPWVGPVIGFRIAALNDTMIDATDAGGTPATQDQVNSTGSGATGGTHVEATYDNTTRDTIDNAGADLKGGGLVGIPVTGHAFTAGREITIAGSVAYNGAFDIVSQTANEVVIAHAQTAEAFTGAETIVSSIKGQIFVGTITSGTFANTSTENGTLHSMDDDGDDIDIVYGFNIGGSREATAAGLFTNVDGNTDQMQLTAYDFAGSQWEANGNGVLPGSGGSSFSPLNPELLKRNTGTGTDLGNVFLRIRTVTTTPSSLDVDKCLLTAVGTNVVIGYPNGFEVAAAGESGTVFGLNGTAGRPCPFADAVAMNAVNVLNEFKIHNGETIQLIGVSDQYSLIGQAWTLQLNDKSIVNMHTSGAISVSGGSTGSNSSFDNCDMGTCTIAPCKITDSRFTSDSGGGFTMQTAGDYTFHHCGSMVPSNGSPVFTFPASGNTFVNDRAGSGGRRFEGMSSGDLASVEGWGQFIEGTCSGGAVTIRGCLTTSGIQNISITDEARFDILHVADAVLDEVNTGADHNVINSLGRQIREGLSLVIGAFDVISATSNTVTIDGSASAVSGSYDPSRIFVFEGTGSDQTGTVTEYFGSAGGNGNPARTLIFKEDFKVSLDSSSKILILANDGRMSTNQGQLRAGSTTTAALNSLAPVADVAGQTLHFTSGTGRDQTALIRLYSNPVATFEAIDVAVDATTGYELLPIGCVNLEQIQHSAQSATDLKDFADDGYDPSTDKVQGVVLVDATSTVSDGAKSALFTGITSLAQWLGLIAGKQTPNATALTEIKATGAGSGTYDATAHSQEANRDRGDAAWITAIGFAVAGDQMDLVDAPNATAITAIQSGLSTFDHTSDKVTPIDVDGITFASAMELLMAVQAGVATVNGNDVSFKLRDGTTSKATITYTATDGTRSVSTIDI